MSDWRCWKITDEQAEQIRAKNVEAIDRFYFDNLHILRKMACKYAYKHPRSCDSVDDLLNTLYLDLFVFWRANGTPVYDGLGLTLFVYYSFRNAYYGGLAYLVENNPKFLCSTAYRGNLISLDKPLISHRSKNEGEEGRHLGDIVPCYDKHDDGETEMCEACKRLCADLLTKRQREYIGYFLDGYGTSATAKKMGYKNDSCGSVSDGAIKALKKNSSIILQRLEDLGVNVDSFKGLDPLAKKERSYKLSAEKRARASELARARRARLRAETSQPTDKEGA